MAKLSLLVLKKLKADKRSLRELESLTGISYAMLSYLRNGKKRPGADSLDILAEFYDLIKE